jgi:hypothetical protein
VGDVAVNIVAQKVDVFAVMPLVPHVLVIVYPLPHLPFFQTQPFCRVFVMNINKFFGFCKTFFPCLAKIIVQGAKFFYIFFCPCEFFIQTPPAFK